MTPKLPKVPPLGRDPFADGVLARIERPLLSGDKVVVFEFRKVKPDLVGSLVTIGLAVVLGVASALPLPHRTRAQQGSAR